MGDFDAVAELNQRFENDRIVSARKGSNQPIEHLPARWDGFRSVRIALPQGEAGLATATYSYKLTGAERCDVARRIAALWNLAAVNGWTVEQIEAATPAGGEEGR